MEQNERGGVEKDAQPRREPGAGEGMESGADRPQKAQGDVAAPGGGTRTGKSGERDSAVSRR